MGVTHGAISRRGTRQTCRLTQHGGMIGGGHRASRTRRSAVEAHAHCADWLGMEADEQHQREQC